MATRRHLDQRLRLHLALPITTPERPARLILPRNRPLPEAGQAFEQCLRDYLADLRRMASPGL